MNSALKSPSSALRTRLIAKIHVAKKEMAMSDDDYRAFLTRVSGKSSSSALAISALENVLEEMKSMGFKAKQAPKKAGTRRQDKSPQSRKIRGMWITLHQMGQVEDPSEQALNVFVERITGISDLKWLWSRDADKVIKALRGWITRCGGDPDDYA